MMAAQLLVCAADLACLEIIKVMLSASRLDSQYPGLTGGRYSLSDSWLDCL